MSKRRKVILVFGEPREGRRLAAGDMPLDAAREMAAVGIVPSIKPREPGHVLTLAGQRFIVTGPATRKEFLEAVARAGLPANAFAGVPKEFYFLKVSTD